MSRELNCMNCCIGDFKHRLCSCDGEFCKRFKSIGSQEDFMEKVMKQLPSHGEWIYGQSDIAFNDGYKCSCCGYFVPWDYKHKSPYFIEEYSFCPHCGANMRGESDDR